jgi:class 3 adenylate cyclase
MLANIDMLIAIWDGEVAAGVGGTAQIVERAIADGIVVVWIEPSHPNAIRISWPGDGAAPAGASAGLKSTFRPADVATVAEVVEKTLTSPTQ